MTFKFKEVPKECVIKGTAKNVSEQCEEIISEFLESDIDYAELVKMPMRTDGLDAEPKYAAAMLRLQSKGTECRIKTSGKKIFLIREGRSDEQEG